jgi:hypothetical protein
MSEEEEITEAGVAEVETDNGEEVIAAEEAEADTEGMGQGDSPPEGEGEPPEAEVDAG